MENHQASIIEPADMNEDDVASLLSFLPRSAAFDAVLSSDELGQKNDTEGKREKVTHQKFHGGEVFASVKNVSQLRHVDVVVSFGPRKNSSQAPVPIIRNLSPRKVWGEPDASGRSWKLHIAQQCYITERVLGTSSLQSTRAQATAPISPGPRLLITGQWGSDVRRGPNHKAYWTVDEKSKEIVGLPDEIALGMIVEYECQFQANVSVTINLPLWQRSPAMPWSKDDPLLFPARDPGAFVGKQPSTLQFESISDTEWANIVASHESRNFERTRADKIKNRDLIVKSNAKAYRLQGIPNEASLATLHHIIQSSFQLQGKEFDLEPRSLTIDIDRRNGKVATVTSIGLQKLIQNRDHCAATTPSPSNQLKLTLDTRFEALTPLVTPESSKHEFDIFAVPGMAGHAYGSFKERGGEHMWLIDDLPVDFPNARVLTFGYDSKLHDSQSIQDVEGVANTLRAALRAARSNKLDGKAHTKPILFITHSLGGILLKEALIQMDKGDDRDKSDAMATRGILFFGVPSQGIDIASTRAMVKGRANENFLLSIRPDSEFLRRQQHEFCSHFPSRSCKIVSIYEGERSPTARKAYEPDGWKMDGEPALLVGPNSATGGSRSWEVGPSYNFQINRNHSDMVKFYANDPWYKTIVRPALQEMVEGLALQET